MKYAPRNDFVLFRLIDKGRVGSIMTPQKSAQGKERIIVAVGPDVKDIKPGDSVFVIGVVGQDVVILPNEIDLYLTRQANVVLVVNVEDETE